MNDLKLFVVTKKESGYGWSKVEWVKYFLSNNYETIESFIIANYGKLEQYYRYDEAETHITIKEVEVETVTHVKSRNEDDF